MKSPYIAYYTHLIKLSQIANKQTMFLSHMLTMMHYDKNSKQNVVSMTQRAKRMIMTELGYKGSNPLKSADQYINRLKMKKMIASVGGGDWAVDPEDYGYAKYVGLELRMKSKAIFCTYEFDDNGVTETHSIIDNDGNRDVIDKTHKSNGVLVDDDGCKYAISEDGERIDLN